ncbi:hypothetical protein ABT124_47520 [Streptomyces sp. NPDC001982]|uniref:hypothetical protein n=1 Tax=Streptomyces sp. NPDC001982 TaxID=3154405 RepID=UPI00332FD55D
MDQGIVAIVTGAITAVAGVGGTAAGAFVAAKGARKQVREQGAIEHAQWLRQGRSSAYQSYLEGLYAVDVALSVALTAVQHTADGDERERLALAIGELRRLQWQVITAGPRRMGELASQAYAVAQHSVAALANAHMFRGRADSEGHTEACEEASGLRSQLLTVRADFAEGAATVLSSPTMLA